MWIPLLLYLLPLVPRFALIDGEVTAARVVLSLLPLVIVAPSIVLPSYVHGEEEEHVIRHAIYALAFTVAAGTAIRWDVVADAYPDEEWAGYLILFCAGGTVTLWWFVASHMMENSFEFCYTHQGDITVLPLTLVAIATFVYDVPDDAFQFSRSVLFYVPILVSWGTKHFIAFNDFAHSRTTTYKRAGFHFLAMAGLVVGAAHVTLIELRAKPISFIFLAPVASVLSQLTRRPTDPPVLRVSRLAGSWVIQSGLSIAFAFLLKKRFDSDRLIVLNVLVGMTAVAAIPMLCGRRWITPATLYSTLIAASYMDADRHIPSNLRVSDVVVIAAQFFVIFQVTHAVTPVEEKQLSPPHFLPAHEDHHPQKHASLCSITSLLRLLDHVPLPYCRVHGENTVRDMMQGSSPSCPPAFAGIWWCRGSTFPMQLLSVHGHKWALEKGVWTSTFSLRTGTRSATLAGLLNLVGQTPCFTRVEWPSDGRWVRTPGWVFPLLRFFPDTYWLYHVREDEMLRIVFDDGGRVVWQYRMLRIMRGDGHKTRHYYEFMKEYKDVPCILG